MSNMIVSTLNVSNTSNLSAESVKAWLQHVPAQAVVTADVDGDMGLLSLSAEWEPVLP